LRDFFSLICEQFNMTKIKILSWNLYHTVGALVDDVSALIINEKPDIFLMQEVTASIDALPSNSGGYYYRQPWPKRKHGLAVWSKEMIPPTNMLHLPASRMPGKLPQRRAQIINYQGITIANVHLSHGQILNRRQLHKIAKSTNGPTAIIGDYNAFGPVLLDGFSDVGPKAITHKAQRLIPFRLDRCMVRELECNSAKVLPKGKSDHRPIMIEVKQI